MGGTDLWISKWDEALQQWGNPTNFASVNSPDWDGSPSYCDSTGTLYFSMQRIGAPYTTSVIYQSSVSLLTVNSTPVTGIAITGDKPGTSGTTNYTATCLDQDVVTLIAPPSAVVDGVCYEFVRWTGHDGGVREISVLMDAPKSVQAEYTICLRKLTVQSLPYQHVPITGDTPVTTNYDTGKTIEDQTTVQLTAPGNIRVDDRNWYFHYWLVDNAPRPAGLAVLQLNMDADRSATAVYGFSVLGDLNGDCKVNVLDLIYVRNRLGRGCSQ